jgi:tetratricopeptide (TPR) repeat protein
MKMYAKAVPLLEHSLALHIEARGAEHKETVTAKLHLAIADIFTNRVDLGIASMEECCQFAKKTVKQDPFFTIMTMENLGVAYGIGRRWSDALRIIEDVHQLTVALLSDDYQAIIKAKLNLSTIYSRHDRNSEAVEILQETLAICDQHPEDAYSKLLTVRDLSRVYDILDQPIDALPMHYQTVKIATVILGPGNMATLTDVRQMARGYEKCNQPKQAIRLYEQLQEVYLKRNVRYDIWQLSDMLRLGALYNRQRNQAAAILFLEQVVAHCRDTNSSKQLIGKAQRALEKARRQRPVRQPLVPQNGGRSGTILSTVPTRNSPASFE